MAIFNKNKISYFKEQLFGEQLSLDQLLLVGFQVKKQYQEEVQPRYPFSEEGGITINDYCEELNNALNAPIFSSHDATRTIQLKKKIIHEEGFALSVNELLLKREAMKRGNLGMLISTLLEPIVGRDRLYWQLINRNQELFNSIREMEIPNVGIRLYTKTQSALDYDRIIFQVRNTTHVFETEELENIIDF